MSYIFWPKGRLCCNKKEEIEGEKDIRDSKSDNSDNLEIETNTVSSRVFGDAGATDFAYMGGA